MEIEQNQFINAVHVIAKTKGECREIAKDLDFVMCEFAKVLINSNFTDSYNETFNTIRDVRDMFNELSGGF